MSKYTMADLDDAAIQLALEMMGNVRRNPLPLMELYETRPDVYLNQIGKIVTAAISRNQQNTMVLNWGSFLKTAEEKIDQEAIEAKRKEKIIDAEFKEAKPEKKPKTKLPVVR
jgi:hypothetical protein